MTAKFRLALVVRLLNGRQLPSLLPEAMQTKFIHQPLAFLLMLIVELASRLTCNANEVLLPVVGRKDK
jgi:hypothetical protein